MRGQVGHGLSTGGSLYGDACSNIYSHLGFAYLCQHVCGMNVQLPLLTLF